MELMYKCVKLPTLATILQVAFLSTTGMYVTVITSSQMHVP